MKRAWPDVLGNWWSLPPRDEEARHVAADEDWAVLRGQR
jgi:hypothetical protein